MNFSEPAPSRVTTGRIGVVDIGSNTVRMVVYDAPDGLPIPMFNEKAQCELGRDLARTGRLFPEGARMARATLARFVRLADAMGLERLDFVATAAVRDAEDGPDFVQWIEGDLGIQVTVVTGEEEARLAAQGVLHGLPFADGVLGDLGGASLDLVALHNGEFGNQGTLPLGHLLLGERADRSLKRAAKIVKREMDTVPWVAEAESRTLYAVGGSWRNIARLFIGMTEHPLMVIDNFTIQAALAETLLEEVLTLKKGALEDLIGVSRRRAATFPYAAAALMGLLEAVRPRNITFSGFGMREGQMLKSLPDEQRRADPLLSGCTALWNRTGRFSISGTEILDWMAPLFPEETRAERRLRFAACLLSDLGWVEHPDYRARHAFNRVLRVPFAGINHSDRVFLAMALYARYNGSSSDALVQPVFALINDFQLDRATVIGLALRLAHTISGSAPGLLPRTGLEINVGTLVLNLPDTDVFVGEALERRFKTLGRHLGLDCRIDRKA